MRKYKIYIILLVFNQSLLFCQENVMKSFFSHSEFQWTEWEHIVLDSTKTKIIQKLKQNLSVDEFSSTNYMIDDITNYHLIDANSDGILDILYSGSAGSERNSIILFVSEKGVYQKKIETFGYVVNITQDVNYLPLTFRIINNPCCENSEYIFEEYNYRMDNNTIAYKASFYIKFLKRTKFPILSNLKNNTAFKTENDEYYLRTAPSLESNIVSIYPEGSEGRLIYSQYDEIDGRTWWFVLMKNNLKPIKTELNEDENVSSFYSLGWMSNRFLEKIGNIPKFDNPKG